jgi:biopolymer transport protein ExbD
MRGRRKRGYRGFVENDLEIMPLMNLFVAMIPMLLISAVFINVSVIDMEAPPDKASGENASKKPSLALAVTIRDDYYVIEGRQLSKRVIARSDPEAEDDLADALINIAAAYPDNQDIMIISQPRTNYGDIVKVMDISRESGMPGVSLLGVE